MWTFRGKVGHAYVVGFAFVVMASAALLGCGRGKQNVEAQSGQPVPQTQQAGAHSISVTFDYDFKNTPTCSPKGTSKTCVKQFNVYDVSGGRFKLFSIPAPEGATGVVKGITGKSPQRHFEPGTHFIAVAAENGAGVESDVNAAKFTVEIKPDAPAGASGTPNH